MTKTAARNAFLKDNAMVIAPWLVLGTMLAFWPRGPRRLTREERLPGLSEGLQARPEDAAVLEPGRGRDAEKPHQMPMRGWKDILWRTWQEIGADRLPAVAGGVTFYALLSIFPALGAFVSLYGLVADVSVVQQQLNEMSRVFPAEVIQLIGDQMLRLIQQHEAKLGVAFAVSLFLSLWSANAGMKALFDGLNIAYDETERRNFFKRTALTLGFTAGLVLFIGAGSWLLIGLPELAKANGLSAMDFMWLPFRWVALLAMSVLVFAVVFRFGPSRALARWRWVRWGAVFSAVAWLGGSLAFSWYVNTVAHYDATYGTLGAVVAFMMWLWFSTMTLLVGAELNAEIEHQTAVDSTTGAPAPMGQRGAAMADTLGKPFNFSPGEAWRKVGDSLASVLHRGPAAG